jgi:hypothetical protein
MQTNEASLMSAIMKAKTNFPMEDPRWRLLVKANSTFQQSSTATTGLTFYDLEPGAKFLYPVLTPLRNMIPRVSGKGGIEADWRSITALNTSNLSVGVSGGNRGGIQAITVTNNSASYKGLGLEGWVDFEAQYAGQGFDDVRAINAKTLLESLMIGEEKTILGGNPSLALGTTPTPSLTSNSTGGVLLHSQAYYIKCVALGFDGVTNGTVSATGVPGSITRTNADSSTDTYGGGSAAVSAEATVTNSTGSDTYSITATVTAVKGAMGYAWYIGTATGAEYIAAITAVNSYIFTAAPVTTNQLSSALGASDNSQHSLEFAGLLYQALATGSNSYVSAQSGTLTANGAGGVTELETMNKSFWDNYRLGPTDYWVNSQQALDINNKIMATTSSNPGAQRFVFASDQAGLIGGTIIREYLNKFTNEKINIRIHPNMPAGVLLATTSKIPYPLSNVGNVFQVRTRQDYYEIDWPLVTRKWQMGVYADEVLQHYFPPSMGVIYNITAG